MGNFRAYVQAWHPANGLGFGLDIVAIEGLLLSAFSASVFVKLERVPSSEEPTKPSQRWNVESSTDLDRLFSGPLGKELEDAIQSRGYENVTMSVEQRPPASRHEQEQTLFRDETRASFFRLICSQFTQNERSRKEMEKTQKALKKLRKEVKKLRKGQRDASPKRKPHSQT